jgi:hypothetical protein
MENLIDTSLPIDKTIQAPLDPTKAPVVLSDSWETPGQPSVKLSDNNSPLGEIHRSVADLDPIVTAQKIDLAKRMNEPELFVDKNFEQLKKIDQTPDDTFWKRYETNYPKSAEFLKQPKNMAIAKDDIDNLAKTEKIVQDKGFISDMYNGVLSGLSGMNASAGRAAGMVYMAGALIPNEMAKLAGHPELEVKPYDWMLDNPMTKYYDEQQKARAPEIANESVSKMIGDGDYNKAAKALAVQVAVNAPNQLMSMILAMSGVGLAGSLVSSGAMQAIPTLKENLDKGYDPASSTVDALAQGFIEGGIENLSFGTTGRLRALKDLGESLYKKVGKTEGQKVMAEFVKEVGHSFLSEGYEEGLTQVLQDTTHYATVDNTALEGEAGKVLDAALIGGFSGATMTSSGAMLQKGISERKSSQLRKMYLALGEAVGESKLKERSPDAYQAHVEDVIKGTPVENIYISHEAFQEYYQSKGLNPQLIGKHLGIEDQIKETSDTGGDIKIPLATWANKVVGTEHYQGLVNDIKFSPEDYSVNEHKVHKEEITKQMDATDKVISEKNIIDKETKDYADTIYEKVKQDLINKGHDGKQAEHEASLTRQHLIVESANQDKPIQELAAKYVPHIMGDYSTDPISDNVTNITDFKRKLIPQYAGNDVAGSDQVKKALTELGLPEIYHSDESVSAIQEALSFMKNEVVTAEAGKRSGVQLLNEADGEGYIKNINTSMQSSFPKWFKDHGMNKKDFLKSIEKGDSVKFKAQVKQAIKGLKEGHGENALNAMSPNLDFVSLVDPESLSSSFETKKAFAQKANGELFQSEADVRSYLNKESSGKAITFSKDQESAASIDKLTGHLIINPEKITNSKQIDEIISQFGETKRESITGKILATIEGDSHELDAKSLAGNLARKLFNLERLAECGRG